MKEFTMLHKVLLICVFGMCSSFKLKCPDQSQWSLRARAFCQSDPSKYSCIQNEHIKGYTENCSIAQFEKGGMKTILQGNLNAKPCSKERYQPGQMKFLTNVSSECIFSKSKCNEEGQVIINKGSSTKDVDCKCNLMQNYELIYRRTDSGLCKPSEEDCSCFKKQCLLTDYFCRLTPTIAKDPRLYKLRIEPEEGNIIKRGMVVRTFIVYVLILLVFSLSVLLYYAQDIDNFIHGQGPVTRNFIERGRVTITRLRRRQHDDEMGQRSNSFSMTESDISNESQNNKSDNYCISSGKIKSFNSDGKPVIDERILQKWKGLEKDKKCRIKIEPCYKTVFKKGWIANENDELMNILFMRGTLNSIEADIIICPVNKELVPIGFDSEELMGGLNKENLHRRLTKTSAKNLQQGGVIRIYDPENINCHCLLLTILDKTLKGNFDSLEQCVAEEVIDILLTGNFRSLGISLNYNKNPEWKLFSSSLLSCLWGSKSKLKCPVVVYCFGEKEEFARLDKLVVKLKTGGCLIPIKTEPLQYQNKKKNSIKVSIEKGSILKYETKVDVLINSVGASLDLRNGIVSAKLVEKAGPSVQDDCNRDYEHGLKIGDIAITSPGNLICKNIFHVALYPYWVCDGNISMEILKNIVIKCLKEAEYRELKSIAFPALGTGNLKYPHCAVAKTMFAAVDEYGRTHPTYVKRVFFVLFEDDVFKNFENIGKWKKHEVKNSIEYDIPSKQLVFIPRDLETRVNVTHKEYVSNLKYKDLKAVVTESTSLEMKMDWNDQDGCYVTKINTGHTEEEVKAYFAKLIKHMHENKFQTVDLFFQNISSEVTVNNQLRILMSVIQQHGDRINKKNSKKTGSPEINYVKLVRVYLKSEDYAEIETEYKQSNDKQKGSKHGEWKCHVSDKSSLSLIVEIVGPESAAKDVYNEVLKDTAFI